MSFRTIGALALVAIGLPTLADADVVCSAASYCEVVFNRTYEAVDSQFYGQPYNLVTVAPNGSGETFRNANGVDEGDALRDIEIRVYLRNCQGEPIAGTPSHQISLFSNALCICPGGSDSDAGTDANGLATFTGTLRAGGCTTSLSVYADGVFIGTLEDANGHPVKINSADQAHLLCSPCFVDAGDLAGFASVFGNRASDPGTFCFDYNERGVTIDASDLAAMAFVLGAACR